MKKNILKNSILLFCMLNIVTQSINCYNTNIKDVDKYKSKSLLNSTEISTTDTLIYMERTVCYGPCPAYELLLLSDGTIFYEGVSFVKVEGIYRWSINKDSFKSLIEK